jgi:lipid A 4'-phosphatase
MLNHQLPPDARGAVRACVHLLLSAGLAGAVFLWDPALDLAVSRMLFDPERGLFPLAWNPALAHFTVLVQKVTYALPFLLAALWLAAMLWSKAAIAMRLPPHRVLLFLFLASVLAPGILASLVKDHFGRARPIQVTEFGGTLNFTSAFTVSGQCRRNCSFVSGDATSGFVPVAFALLARRRRNFYLCCAIGFGVLVGINRVLAGKHFLSDVVFAGLLSVLSIYGLYFWLIARRAAGVLWRPQDEVSKGGEGNFPLLSRVGSLILSFRNRRFGGQLRVRPPS